MEWCVKENRIAVIALHKLGMEPSVIFQTLQKLDISKIDATKRHKGRIPDYRVFVMVYPYHGVENVTEPIINFIVDNKPFAYPFDRPVNEAYFMQPNMNFKDVFVYHEDDIYPYQYYYPYYVGYRTPFTKY